MRGNGSNGIIGILKPGGGPLMFFGKKELAIIQLFEEHLEYIGRTLENSKKSFLLSYTTTKHR
jgi:hypothetical protein